MFFKRRKENDTDIIKRTMEYFKYRDSLTGQMNCSYARRQYEIVKNVPGWGAVMLRLSGSDSMPLYKAEKCLAEVAGIIARILSEETARIENGDFILFSENYVQSGERLKYFADRLSGEGNEYAVVFDKLDAEESFDLLLGRLRRYIGAEEIRIEAKLPIK